MLGLEWENISYIFKSDISIKLYLTDIVSFIILKKRYFAINKTYLVVEESLRVKTQSPEKWR